STALQHIAGGKLVIFEGPWRSLRRKAGHYAQTLGRLDFAQVAQVIQDKFDPEHAVRSRLLRPLPPSSVPLVLLPSAYVNVSRTAVAFARMLTEVQFLLVHARTNGRLADPPPNVRQASLDGYLSGIDNAELPTLGHALTRLCQEFRNLAPELELAAASGLL